MSELNIPDPVTEQAAWAASIAQIDDKFSLRHYREAGRKIKKGKLWTIEVGQRIHVGLNAQYVDVVMLTVEGGDKVNHFFMTDDAKVFWRSCLENGKTADEIHAGWEGMQSILNDGKQAAEA